MFLQQRVLPDVARSACSLSIGSPKPGSRGAYFFVHANRSSAYEFCQNLAMAPDLHRKRARYISPGPDNVLH